MNKQEILELLHRHKPELARRYGVRDLALFGSSVRGTAREDSDIDILVTFDGPATSRRYFGLLFYWRICSAVRWTWCRTRHCGQNFASMWSKRQSMSERKEPKREWRFYVDDMRQFAEKVLAYTEGMGQEDFVESGVTYDATLRNLELIGEAATPCA